MKRAIAVVFCLLAASVPTLTPAAGLVSVRQSIFGMDCAPCAYGLDKGLKALSGVETVKVSLNEGYAEVTFAPGSDSNLGDIQRITRESGFTPKEATLTVVGTVQAHPTPRLMAGGHGIDLAWADEHVPANLDGRESVVSGTVASDSETLVVASVKPATGEPK